MKKTGLILQILLIVILLAGCAAKPTLTISPPNTASALEWTPSGKYIISNGYDSISANAQGNGAIGAWDVAANAFYKALVNETDPHDYANVGQLDSTPDETYLLITTPFTASRTMGFVSLYDIARNNLLVSWEGLYLDDNTSNKQESIQSALFSPDGSQFAIAGSFYVRIFDTSTRTLIEKFATLPDGNGSEKEKVTMVWSPDGSQIAWLIQSDLSIYDLASHETRILKNSGTGSIPAPNLGLDWSPDGSTLVYEKDWALHFIDVATGELASSIPIDADYVDYHIKSIKYSPDGKYIAFCASEYVSVWELSTQKVVLEQKMTHPENELYRYEDVSWSPDSKSIAVLSYGAKEILVFTLVE